MRKVGHHLEIVGDSLGDQRAFDYEASVHHQLLTIMGVGELEKKVGRLVLLEIVNSGKVVRIVPLPNQLQAIANGPTPLGPSPLARPFDPLTNRPSRDRVDGGNTTIQFSPETWWYNDRLMGWHPTLHKYVSTAAFPNVKALDPTGRNIEPDDILMHELVHAARAVQGLLCDNVMNKLMDPRQGVADRVEEFYAVMITNMYVSERSDGRQLRADHDGTAFHQLNMGVAEYVRTFRNEIADFCDEMPEFARKLSAVQCKFNPIDVYLRNPRVNLPSTKFDDLSAPPSQRVNPGDFIPQTTFPSNWSPR